MDKNILNLTTIILTYNEEIHIRRCLENVCPFSKRVVVVDSPSTDRTVEICQEFPDVEVVVHKYPGNQAAQFNWALDNCNIETEWVLRVDADEYLTPELIDEIQAKLPTMSNNISAVVLPLGRAFLGRILKHGIVNGVSMIRLFRFGRVRYEQRLMDEHLKVLNGEAVTFEHKFVDDNRMSLRTFVDKHNNYSTREAAVLLDAEYGLSRKLSAVTTDEDDGKLAKEVAAKRAQKAKYAKLPLFWRAFAYFIYRYIFKMGFLDGKEGFLWDFLQGWWYRTLVDAKIFEIKKACNITNTKTNTKTGLDDENKEKIREYLKREYGIEV